MAVDQVLKKNFWAVLLVLVGGVAFLNAQGLTQIVGAGLAPDEKQLATLSGPGRSTAPAPSSAPFHVTSADAILSRKPFDSVTGPLHAQPIAPPAPRSPPSRGPPAEPTLGRIPSDSWTAPLNAQPTEPPAAGPGGVAEQ